MKKIADQQSSNKHNTTTSLSSDKSQNYI